jgi:capsular exopolysaccharide synthesis family protein
VLGIVPRVDPAGFAEQLASPQSSIAEAYRSLRTALQFTGTEGAPATLLVTSSEPNEGKSTTAFKLAQDFAALGASVLIIDADLRKPSLHRMFGLNNVLGLSNLLTNTMRADDAPRIFRRTAIPNVTLVTAGTVPPNPADLLSSPKMGMIINACSSRYDMIILDGPPIVGLADAPILSRLIETTLLVVSAGQVTRKSAVAALKRLKAAGGVIAGAALTKFEVNKFEYNYAYRYMDYQYYTYGTETTRLPGASREEADDDEGKPVLRSIRARIRDLSQRTGRHLYGNR